MAIRPNDKETRKRLARKYRLTVTDENSLYRLINIRMGWLRFFASLAIVVTLLGFIGILFVITTPLKSILPGYLYTYEREDVMTTTRKIDSISNEVAIRNAYVDNILDILQNNVDSVVPSFTDSVPAVIPIDSIITASEIERDYVNQYENNQKFNISVLTPLAAGGFTFVNPLQGAEAREPEEGEDPRRVTFDLPRMQPVSAVYRGTVLDVYNTMDAGFTVLIQHPNEFVSRYSGLTDVAVRRGESVNPGMRIGMIDRARTMDFGIQPTFELWYKGAAVNPREYVPF